jgi:hypothetical protein
MGRARHCWKAEADLFKTMEVCMHAILDFAFCIAATAMRKEIVIHQQQPILRLGRSRNSNDIKLLPETASNNYIFQWLFSQNVFLLNNNPTARLDPIRRQTAFL